MKFVLVGVVLAGVGYIGYGLSRFYKRRKRFFEDLTLFCEKLCVDISFSSETLKTIINQNYENFFKDFKVVLSGYLTYLETNGSTLEAEGLFKKLTIVKPEEKEAILMFFKNLGRLDVCNQVSEITNFKLKFLDFKKGAEEENKKFGSLSLKLMILLGILVVIILI